MLHPDPQQKETDKTRGTRSYPLALYDNLIDLPSDGYRLVNYCHWHEETEIVMVLEGTLKMMIGGELYAIDEGEIAFVDPYELHEFFQNGRTRFYAFLFPLTFLSAEKNDEPQMHYIDPLLSGQLRFPTFIGRDHPVYARLAPIVREFLTANTARQHGYELLTKADLMLTIYHCLPHMKPAHGSYRTCREIADYIKAHYAEKITLADLSRRFAMSEKYISEYFSRNFRQNLTDYCNGYRIKKACELLGGTEMSITQVANEVGFDNISYFIKVFKRLIGTTPLQFRKTSQSI